MKKLFGKSVPLDEQIRNWKRSLKGEERTLERQIRERANKGIETEEKKLVLSLKQAAKKPGNEQACKVMAKELVKSRKAKERIYGAKAQLNSVGMQLSEQLCFCLLTIAMIKVAGSLQQSTKVMQIMNNLVKLPEISAVMQEMSKEMMKAGIMEEMMNDTFEAMEDDSIEAEADEEVNKVLQEITTGMLSQAGSVPIAKPVQKVEQQQEEEEEIESMESRLKALRT